MEALDTNCVSSPVQESLNHDFPIRRFCPARLQQQQDQQGQWEETVLLNQMDLTYSSLLTTSSFMESSAMDQFVDSFINIDHSEDEDKSSANHHLNFNHFENEIDFGHEEDINMMIEAGDDVSEMSGSYEENAGIVPQVVPSVSHGVDQGLQLVHMLLACAEAVGCRDTKLAESILGEVWSSATPLGDSLQRVSYCFAMGLKSRISLLNHVNSNGTFTNCGAADVSLITRQEKQEAFQLLHQTTPYVSFGFLAANEAILEAAKGKDSLHIIDLEMEHTLQWPSLIRSLASRTQGPPKIRITGLIDGRDLLQLEVGMKVIAEDASSLGIQVEYMLISESVCPSLLTTEKLRLREGEAFIFNSVMKLHKYVKESRGSVKAILQAVKKLGPTALVVVEQDANHNGPFFLGRFLESLHHYSAIFDSLEASLPRNSTQRMKIERFHFAEEIQNVVACEGSDRIERHERADQWRRQLGRAGFQVMGLKCISQARMMLSVYGCDGFTLTSEKGCILLGWKGRPILLASAWQVHNASPRSS